MKLSLGIERNPWHWSIGVAWYEVLTCSATCDQLHRDDHPRNYLVSFHLIALHLDLTITGKPRGKAS